MEDHYVPIKKIKENQSQKHRNLANCKKSHSQAQFLNVETRSMNQSEVFEKTEKENYLLESPERRSSVTKIVSPNPNNGEGWSHLRQVSEKKDSKEFERYINTIDSLNHLISNNFKLERELKKKGRNFNNSDNENSSLIESQQKKIKQLEELVQRLELYIQEKAKMNKVVKNDVSLNGRSSRAFNLRNLQLQQHNADLLRSKNHLESKLLKLQAQFNTKKKGFQQQVQSLQKQNQKLALMLQKFQQQKKEKPKCQCKERYSAMDKQEIKQLKEQLKLTNGELAYCRKELQESKEAYRKEAQNNLIATEMLEELQELFKEITKKAAREAKALRQKIESLQKSNLPLEQKVIQQQKVINDLKAKVEQVNRPIVS